MCFNEMMFIYSPYYFDFKTVEIYEKNYANYAKTNSAKNHPSYAHPFIYSNCDHFQLIFYDYRYNKYLTACLIKML